MMKKWLAPFILVICVAQPQAQMPAWAEPQASPAYRGVTATGANPATTAATTIDLLVGRSTILSVPAPIARVSLTVPDIADALVTAPQQLLIHGKSPGTISLFVWDKTGGIRTYEVVVRRDLSVLSGQLKELFPGEEIAVYSSGKDVVVSGTVSSKYVVEKAAEVATGYVEKKDNVVNLLKQQEGVASNQVLLRVRFAEVSRTALSELGASWFTGPNGFHDYISQLSTQQFPSIQYDEFNRTSVQSPDNWGGGRDTVTATGGKMTFSDLLNFMIFSNRYSVGAIIKALSQKGLFQSLAEPNLVSTNGKEASFLAGGEFPYPVAQASAGGTTISIQFKEFGVRLNFTPTILADDVVSLKVKPEVSALDFTNAITIQGFRIPALSTRRTETEVELRDGQTFAVAGLLNNNVTNTMRKIPGIGDIPILGWLFKSRALLKGETELVVIITPHILRKGSPGAATGLPNMVEPFMGRPGRQIAPPPAHLGSPRYPMKGQEGPDGPASAQESPTGRAVDSPAVPAPTAAQPQVARPATNPTAPAGGTSLQARPEGQARPEVQVRPNAPAVVIVPAPAATAPATPPPAPRALTKAEQKRIEEARKVEQAQASRQAQEDAKRRLDEQKRTDAAEKAAARQAEADRKVAEKRAAEQARRDAEAARKADEVRKRKAEEDAKRAKEIAEAEARLKEAQAAYLAALQKTSAQKTKTPPPQEPK
jgi:pilus assembly protein CpaC